MAELFRPTPDDPPPARGRWSLRLDHVLLVVGAVVMIVGSFMPWIHGQTRRAGFLDWTGIDDTGEGGMLLVCALIVLGFVRWRGSLEDIEPRTRWLPLLVAIAATFLWVIPLRKILGLVYEVPGGARTQFGLFLAGIGVLFTLGGAVLASRAWADPLAPPRRRRARPQAKPTPESPGSGGYATRSRVERRDPPPDG
jgi:amino acid transporter